MGGAWTRLSTERPFDVWCTCLHPEPPRASPRFFEPKRSPIEETGRDASPRRDTDEVPEETGRARTRGARFEDRTQRKIPLGGADLERHRTVPAAAPLPPSTIPRFRDSGLLRSFYGPQTVPMRPVHHTEPLRCRERHGPPHHRALGVLQAQREVPKDGGRRDPSVEGTETQTIPTHRNEAEPQVSTQRRRAACSPSRSGWTTDRGGFRSVLVRALQGNASVVRRIQWKGGRQIKPRSNPVERTTNNH